MLLFSWKMIKVTLISSLFNMKMKCHKNNAQYLRKIYDNVE